MPRSGMDSGVSALIGAAVGATAAFGSGLLLEWFKRQRDRRSTAHAFAGSIEAFMTINSLRGYHKAFEEALPAIYSGQRVRLPIWESDTLDPVAKCYLDKVGMLSGRHAARVAAIISYLATIRAETIRINNGEYNDEKSGTVVAIALISIWQSVNQEGFNICGDLRAFVGDWDLNGKDRLVSRSHKS
jgi:hypothetical protein